MQVSPMKPKSKKMKKKLTAKAALAAQNQSMSDLNTDLQIKLQCFNKSKVF